MALSGTDFDSSPSIVFRVKHTDLNGALTNFPVALELGTSVGIKSNDVSAIFDELGSNANRLKIAVEDGDTGNQCYVDIAYWDDGTEDATLHVKVPSLPITGYSYLRLYYDSAAADNTTYVSDTGGTAAQSVWDANFISVCHHTNDPNGDVADAIKDATSGDNDGTPNGTMLTADLVDVFPVGKGIDFDNTDDYIDFGANADQDITGDLTIEAVFSPNSSWSGALGSDEPIVDRIAASAKQYNLSIDAADSKLQLTIDATTYQSTTNSWTSGTNYVVAATLDAGTANGQWVDGVDVTGAGGSGTTPTTSVGNSLYAAYDGTNFFDGIIGEVRISDKVREDEWIQATNLSLTDTLVTADVDQLEVTGSIFGTQGMQGSIAINSPSIDISGTLYEMDGTIDITYRPQVELSGTLYYLNGSLSIDNIDISGTIFSLGGSITVTVNSKLAVTGSLYSLGGSIDMRAGVGLEVSGTLYEVNSTAVVERDKPITISGTIFEMGGSLNVTNHNLAAISGTLFCMNSVEINIEPDNLSWELSETLEYERYTKC